MATFVMVPGAWLGGWCWKRVAKLLRNSGHEVFTPTLTGLGERSHLSNYEINLETHIQDIVGVINSEELSEVVLCGHSYGGMVITGVADQMPDRIRSLVYLDALVPSNGQCVLDLLPAEAASGFQNNAVKKGLYAWIEPVPSKAFGTNAKDEAWVDRRSTAHPLKTFEQPITLQGKCEKVPRHIYLYATGWEDGVGKPFYENAQKKENWEAITLSCGHNVMVDNPDDLAKILIESI